ncbi:MULTISPECIES: hypothetical protein [Actinomadura]|uniref:Uncharacterized protein n=1 Tax=Actinomadura madurae TaxID=1993 RepID=A0A1I4VSL2_9ACTN|nr:hypothetical protein [Actinomadura madurae]SFN04291.1 hypothetical protein SAMN04489713_1013 [Actinomadura madurae]SPT58322.1 Uncharacterised protein [Actinomadura madurae]
MTNDAGWLERSRRKRADRLAALDDELERRLPARYARRRPRRVLAGAGAVTLGLFWVDAAVSWALAPSDTAMISNFVILGVLVVVGFPLAGQLIAVTRGLTSKRERELDERQLTARLRAFATAHRATTYVMIAVVLAVSVADRDGRDSQIPGAALFLILFALLVTHALLPLVVAAWQAADPPADEDEDEDGETGEAAA